MKGADRLSTSEPFVQQKSNPLQDPLPRPATVLSTGREQGGDITALPVELGPEGPASRLQAASVFRNPCRRQAKLPAPAPVCT